MATDSLQHSASYNSQIIFRGETEAESVVVPFEARSLEGFRAWALSEDFPDRGKLTFVSGGLIVDMSPESLEKHSEIKTEICRVLANLIRERKLGRLHIDGALFTNQSAGVSNEPDALFVSRQLMKSGRITLTPAQNCPDSSKEIVGTVDWVLEIVSPSSIHKDKVLLREAYYQAEVEEYWLVDALGDHIDFQLLTRGEKEYVSMTPTIDGWLASPTFGRSFRLDREPDEFGFTQFTLHAQ